MLMKYNKKPTFRQHIKEQYSLNTKITTKIGVFRNLPLHILKKQIHFVYI
jgi:hypothetical protein